MKDSIRQRLQKLSDRSEEVGRLLSSEEMAGGSREFRELSLEYARLQPLAGRLQRYHDLERDLQTARDLESDADAGMRALGSEEVARLTRELEAEELELHRLLLPSDPRDERNIFLEVRAGTGGDEAAIFAGDLFRMYARYAESKGFSTEVLSESPGE
ncbi:MAG: PCRF domain-containing protein, partial [Gammaproteobacteria bacterium]|nr:PCRF domain-containing protein [Gammaproteobacteria bacterium]